MPPNNATMMIAITTPAIRIVLDSVVDSSVFVPEVSSSVHVTLGSKQASSSWNSRSIN